MTEDERRLWLRIREAEHELGELDIAVVRARALAVVALLVAVGALAVALLR